MGRENPAELKAQKLSRSMTRGVIDKDLKPNVEETARIEAILRLPPNRALSPDDRELLWRLRYSQIPSKRALTKFLKCVDWGDLQEAREAAEVTTEPLKTLKLYPLVTGGNCALVNSTKEESSSNKCLCQTFGMLVAPRR